jgi:hypothetical protein
MIRGDKRRREHNTVIVGVGDYFSNELEDELLLGVLCTG